MKSVKLAGLMTISEISEASEISGEDHTMTGAGQ
jgi:hypothetical protein